jgi:hypothetical protein
MQLPLPLEDASRILVMGAGGGYDVVCALPVALALRARGHTVHLASYSAMELAELDNTESPMENLYAVTRHSGVPENTYSPEGHLARWWHQVLEDDVTVWTYSKVGVRPLSKILAHLTVELSLNVVVVVDAGVDALFEGSEHELGTPTVDAISLCAVRNLPNIQRYLAFTAFGTEGKDHKVRHADALLRISQQIALGGMLGVCALLPGQEEGRHFSDAVDFIHAASDPEWHSNMAGSVQAAMKGKYGYQTLNVRTRESPIWVSPLTLLYWFFQLDTVVASKPFGQDALTTQTPLEMFNLIQATRERSYILPRADIPI